MLKRDRFSLCAQTEPPPYEYLSVEGPIALVERADLERHTRVLAHRHTGVECGDAYNKSTGARDARDSSMVIEMRPERWLTVDYRKAFGGWVSRGRTASLIAAGSVSLLACFAHRASTPLDLEPVPVIADYERRLVVGVREPEIKLDRPSYSGEEPAAGDSQADLRRAISLIRSLRQSGLYFEVDFQHRLRCPPDLVLETRAAPRLSSCDRDALMLSAMYLGVLPTFTTCDGGHYFAASGGNSFEFPWHETGAFGWLVLPLNLLESWSWGRPELDKSNDAFRAFLLANKATLLTTTNSEERALCPAE